MQMPALKPILYFDGQCPVCAREIGMYRRSPGADQIHWVDASQCGEAELGSDLARTDALARLHLRLPEGRLVQGAEAFARLWHHLPRWAWLGRLALTPPGLWLLGASYRFFLSVRPLWRRSHSANRVNPKN
jgi:predicted DCC family thiol-disulfide oxidoreductase YuxK